MNGFGWIGLAAGMVLTCGCGPRLFEDEAHYYYRQFRSPGWGESIVAPDGNTRGWAIKHLGQLGPRAKPVVPQMLEEIRKDGPNAHRMAEAFEEIGPVTPEVIPTHCCPVISRIVAIGYDLGERRLR